MSHELEVGKPGPKKMDDSVRVPLEVPKLLDCSFRDGGYLNGWDFPLSLIRKQLERLSLSGVEFCELGLRLPQSTDSDQLGFLGNVSPGLVRELAEQFPAVKLGVMANSRDFDSTSEIMPYFRGKPGAEGLGFIRIATHLSDFSKTVEMALALTEVGYPVFVNVMQVSEFSLDTLSRVFDASPLDHLAGLYFADSTGALTPKEVRDLVDWALKTVSVPIGVHFHDNLSLAFANSLEAVDRGAIFVDGTVLGVGRGAGNTRLELLALEYLKDTDFREIALLTEDWERWLGDRSRFDKWGPSWEYGLASRRRVHPTYVQMITEREDYSASERLAVISELGQKESMRYSESGLRVGLDWFETPGQTSKGVTDLFSERSVLLLGPGNSASQCREEIEWAIAAYSLVPCVVGAREAGFGSEYRFLSHPLTLMAQPEILDSPQTLIGPLSQLQRGSGVARHVSRGLSVNMELSDDRFGFDGKTVSAHSTRSAIFALALLSGLRCQSIFLAGFDGFPEGDPRNGDFEAALRAFKQSGKSVISLTPTRYDVPFRFFE